MALVYFSGRGFYLTIFGNFLIMSSGTICSKLRFRAPEGGLWWPPAGLGKVRLALFAI